MAIHEIPTETFVDILINIDRDISSASPYAPLMTEEVDGNLGKHLAWLESHALLESPAQNGIPVALEPEFRRSLDIVARPIRRITVSEVSRDRSSRAVYLTNGIEVVLAMIRPEECVVSDPVDLEAFRDSLLAGVGKTGRQNKKHPGFTLHPATLALLGSLEGPWGDVGQGGPPEPLHDSLDWPIPRTECETRLTDLLGGESAEDAGELIDGLIEDHILQAKQDELGIHPDFRGVYDAISSGEFVEIQRIEIPNSDIEQINTVARSFLVGPRDARILMWPADDESGDVMMFAPTDDELKTVINYMVGWADVEGEE